MRNQPAPMPDWLKKIYNIDGMRRRARRELPRPVFDFADGASEDEVTMRRNEAVFDEVSLLPRPLQGSPARDLSVQVFDHRISMPLMIGPTGLSGLFWPDGERETARAAGAMGTGFCLSHGSTCTIEELAGTGTHPRWMQVFVYRDRAFTRELAERAKAAGYDALVLTIDNQILSKRERDHKNGFKIPPDFSPLQYAAMMTKVGWLWRMRDQLNKMTFANYGNIDGGTDLATLAGRMSDLLDPGMNWADVDELRKVWDGPLVLKGILHPDDARIAMDHGVDGLVVSNHGGRQLDTAIPSLTALQMVAETVDGRIPLFMDGGVRRGTDVLKALACGATACLLGRPHLWGVASAGEAGVTRVLQILRDELDMAMGLCGLTKIADVGPAVLAGSQNRL